MKQCPRCNRTYADDALSYCLDDGAILVSGYDPEATQISQFPPASNLPPTVAYAPTPAPPAPMPAPVPEQRPRSALAIGAMVLAVLAVCVAIAGFILQRNGSPSSNAPQALPTPRSVAASTATPTPVPATPTPTPRPAPTTTPLPVAQSTPKPEAGCVLYNDKTDKAMVTVRRNCDTQDCETDESTIIKDYPNNTPIRRIKGATMRGTRFTWEKVVITDSGQTVWVASAKIKCD